LIEIAVESAGEIVEGEEIRGGVGKIIEGGRIEKSAGKAKGRAREIVEGGRIKESAEKLGEIVESGKMGGFAARMNFFFNFVIFVFAFRSILVSSSYAAFSLGV
jgi:hypothetical protein